MFVSVFVIIEKKLFNTVNQKITYVYVIVFSGIIDSIVRLKNTSNILILIKIEIFY